MEGIIKFKCTTNKSLLLIFFSLISICALLTLPSLVFRCGLTAKVQGSDLYLQDAKKTMGKYKIKSAEKVKTAAATAATGRRRLGGPGSSPPRCAWKCGRCSPCKPVHVPVPPGNPVTAEYYPEAWRCKCGNKLYMP